MLPFYTALETRKKQRFSCVLRVYKMETSARNGLKGQLPLQVVFFLYKKTIFIVWASIFLT